MNLYHLLRRRAESGEPLGVGLIGAGKFGSMFLAQTQRIPGVQLLGIADLNPARARQALRRCGWPEERFAAGNFAEAVKRGTTHVTGDASALIAARGIQIVIDATGNPAAGIQHVLACCANKKHIIMVNVEADALAGPLLARRAHEAGIIYSLGYGDQPALICELVDWARAAGFEVIAAGKGTKYLPEYHGSTPDTVWSYYGFSEDTVKRGDFNAQMFNSFVDGTKSAIEMAAVANATGLSAGSQGLCFPPCGADELPQVLRPKSAGGVLEFPGMVEVVSSLKRDGTPVARDLRWGIYVVFSAPNDYVARCFKEYGLMTDESGRYAATYKPFHLIGLELGISIASVGLRNEPTGTPKDFRGDVATVAKRNLNAGELLDGEGGYTVYGRLMPARDSLELGCLPIGLAHGVKLKKSVRAGSPVTWNDVIADENNFAVRFRLEMEKLFKMETRVAVALANNRLP
ncbi:MAG TPA: Gfo/Idh/MocA family oxidoreductase [Burkholderiales bacterium]|nr:Gfo/Idh/MocA family oxidoreductase [Burkholderiales bacterium]